MFKIQFLCEVCGTEQRAGGPTAYTPAIVKATLACAQWGCPRPHLGYVALCGRADTIEADVPGDRLLLPTVTRKWAAFHLRRGVWTLSPNQPAFAAPWSYANCAWDTAPDTDLCRTANALGRAVVFDAPPSRWKLADFALAWRLGDLIDWLGASVPVPNNAGETLQLLGHVLTQVELYRKSDLHFWAADLGFAALTKEGAVIVPAMREQLRLLSGRQKRRTVVAVSTAAASCVLLIDDKVTQFGPNLFASRYIADQLGLPLQTVYFDADEQEQGVLLGITVLHLLDGAVDHSLAAVTRPEYRKLEKVFYLFLAAHIGAVPVGGDADMMRKLYES